MVKLFWEKGGECEVVECDGLGIVVQSSAPYPPGSPLHAKTAEGAPYHVKVRGCRRTNDGALPFRIDGRLFNLDRAQRSALLEALNPGAAADGTASEPKP